MTIQQEVFELLSSCKSTRAYVNQLPCTCTKGKGITRKQKRLCNQCQALSILGSMRRRLEKLKGIMAIQRDDLMTCPICLCEVHAQNFEHHKQRCGQVVVVGGRGKRIRDK